MQFTHFLRVASFVCHLGKVLDQGVSQLHYIFESDAVTLTAATTTGGTEQSASEQSDHLEKSQRKEKRLGALKKSDAMVGSKVQSLRSSQQKPTTQKVSLADADWQYSRRILDQGGQRLFIHRYQSSPLDLYVSALNERLKKQKKEESKQADGQKDELELLIE